MRFFELGIRRIYKKISGSGWLFANIVSVLILESVALALAFLMSLFTFMRLFSRRPACQTPAKNNSADAVGWEKLDQLLDMLSNLQEEGVSYSGLVSREDFGKAVLKAACRLMNCERGSIMLWEESGGHLKIVAAVPETGKPQTLFLKPGEGIAGEAFSKAQTILIEDPSSDPRYLSSQNHAHPFLSMPLLIQSKPIGVLNLHATGNAAPFKDHNAKFLKILASEAAVTFHNLELFERLETFYLEMVKTLARAVDSKDHYTHEHSDRASSRAKRLAKALDLDPVYARYVEYAALLHDIGKIGIDEAILNKPGKLTAEEYEEMKKHPLIGHQILAPVKFLGPVAQMVLHHQEWYDGRGYPSGLKGEKIPLGSRIVAVIDAWDAMTSDRPYRKALGREKAIAELQKGAGTQFDPAVVEAFLKIEAKEGLASQSL